MIVPMKKITLFCREEDRQATLRALQKKGVLHVTHVNPPHCDGIEMARSDYNKLGNVLGILSAIAPTNAGMQDHSAPEIMAHVETLIERKKVLDEQQEKLLREQALLQPFGNFNPAHVAALTGKGIHVRLCRAPAKEKVVIPPGAFFHLLNKDRQYRYFVIMANNHFTCGYEELKLPAYSLAEVEQKILRTAEELRAVQESLATWSNYQGVVVKTLREAKEKIAFLEVMAGMGCAEKIAYLQGYCPADKADEIRQESARQGWGVITAEPGEDDDVPTLILSPRWVQPIKTVFTMINILPGYREVDISSVFLVFFSVFTALLIGDAGYGALFLALTFVARMKFPKAPSAPFTLIGILSLSAIIWGVVTGNYFGIAAIPAPFARLRIDWLGNDKNIINVCFMIGAIHLSVAHVWNAVRIINSVKAIAQLGWIGMTWTMYLAARAMILDAPFPSWGLPLVVASFAALLFFQVSPKKIKKDWPDLMMTPLNVIGNFVDVVSYIRLFAVGSASLAVAMNFNEMALGHGVPSVLAGLMAAVILLLGHVLNIALVALGILVHGVRLNTLEFSGHIGVQWKGIRYNPFCMENNN